MGLPCGDEAFFDRLKLLHATVVTKVGIEVLFLVRLVRRVVELFDNVVEALRAAF